MAINAVTTTAYRAAIARAIRRLQAEHGLTDLDFAERIGCSVNTVRNARNEDSDLGPIWIHRIEVAFGAGAVDEVDALTGVRSVPREADPDLDALPSTTAAIHKLALARSPASPGGERITHGELLDMEAQIDAALLALGALKQRCERARAA